MMLRPAVVAGALALAASAAFAQDKPAREKQSAPRVGDLAPTFKLKSLDGKSETDLASFRGKKPVILFFGSYT